MQLSRLRESIELRRRPAPVARPDHGLRVPQHAPSAETMPFDEGMAQGLRLYGCQPYLAEDKYREHIASGRIRREDVAAVLAEDLGPDAGTPLGALGTRYDLRLAMLLYSSPHGPAEELRRYVAEMDALATFCGNVPDALRSRIIDETRQWIAKSDWEQVASRESPARDVLADAVKNFGDCACRGS